MQVQRRPACCGARVIEAVAYNGQTRPGQVRPDLMPGAAQDMRLEQAYAMSETLGPLARGQ